jgi:hypothetical protein
LSSFFQKSLSLQLGRRQATAHSDDDILELLASSSYRNASREERETKLCVQFVSRTPTTRRLITELDNAESQAESTDKVNDF